MNEIIEEASTEAKGSFDLKARLSGRPMRTEKIRVYADEIAGDELGDARDVPNITMGVQVGMKRLQTGVLGEIDKLEKIQEITDLTDEELAELIQLREDAGRLRAALKESALDVELRNVPNLVKQGARRRAKSALDIKGKNIPEEKEDEFNAEHQLQLLADATHSITAVGDGATNTIFTREDAGSLKDYLPESEYLRLVTKMMDVLFKSAIGEAVTESPDF